MAEIKNLNNDSVRFEDGNNLYPSISFISDPNTGLYTDAADSIKITTGGGQRVRVDSNGVGVSANIYIPTGYKMNFDYGVSNNYFVRKDSTTLYMHSPVNLSLQTDGNHRLYINQSGNVGIGTTSPKQRLDVAGAGGKIAITNTGTSDYSEIIFYEGSTVKADIWVNGSTQGNYAGVNSMNIWQGSDAPMAFYTNASERIRITNAGNVGIGTSNPYSGTNVRSLDINAAAYPVLALSVGGNNVGSLVGYSNSVGLFAKTGNYITLNPNDTETVRITSSGNVGIGTTSPNSLLHINGSDPYLRINNSSVNNQGIKISYGNSDTHGLHLLYNPNSATAYIDNTYQSQAGTVYGNIYFRQNVSGTITSRMMIKADSGNVGIGTTSPSYKLDVSGEVRADAYRIDLSATTQRALSSTGTDSLQIGDAGVNDIKFKNAAGNSFIIDSSGAVTLSNYASGLLQVDANGLISVDTNTYLTSETDSQTLSWADASNELTISNGNTVEITGFVAVAGDSMTGNLLPGTDSTLRLGDSTNRWLKVHTRGVTSEGNTLDLQGSSIKLYNGANTAMTIDSSGKVGIGTTSPNHSLDVSGLVMGRSGLATHKFHKTAARYNHGNGYLIATNIAATTDNNFIQLEVTANTYSEGTPLKAQFQCYNYISGGSLIGRGGISTHPDLSVDVFHYNGYVYFWMEQLTGNWTVTFDLYSGLVDDRQITAVTNAAKPTTGVTNSQTINSKSWWTSSNDGTGSGLDADLLDGQEGTYYLDYGNFSNTPSIPVSGTDFDPVGTDNSTNVTLNTTSYDYLSISGQEITLGQIDYSTDIANTPAIPVSGTDFDPVGTDNSTDVTLNTTSYDYLSLTGQEITLGAIDYNADITNLPTLGTAAASAATDFVAVGGDTMTGKLVVEGNSVDWDETIQGTTTGSIHLDPVGTGNNNTGSAITFGASDTGGGATAHAGIYTRTDGGYGTKMYFSTTDNYNSGSKTRMFIGHNGRVGIGTTNPSTPLQVNGVITATGGNSTNWNTAYGWGDHSLAGYSTFDGAYSSLTGTPTLGTAAASDATDFVAVSGDTMTGKLILDGTGLDVDGRIALTDTNTVAGGNHIYRNGNNPYYSNKRLRTYYERVITSVSSATTDYDKYYEIGSFAFTSLEGIFDVEILFNGSGYGQGSRHRIPVSYNMDYLSNYSLKGFTTYSNVWLVADGTFQSPRHRLPNANHWELQFKVVNNTIYFRIVIKGSNGQTGTSTAYVKFLHSNDFDNVTYTVQTGTGTDATDYDRLPNIIAGINGKTLVQNTLIGSQIGIGTTNPTEKLHVDGNANITGWINASNYMVTPLFYNSGDYLTLNKAGNGWLTWADRNTGGTETVVDLAYIGTLSTSGSVTFSNYASGLLQVDANGLVSVDSSSYSTFSGDYADLTNKPSIPVSGTDFDPVGTDNSTNVTLNTTSYDYLSISGQEITLGQIDYSTDIANTPTLGTAAAAAATDFVAVTGDTMTGDLLLQDSVELRLGTDTDLKIYHDGTTGRIANNTGHLYIQNLSDDKDIYLRSDDGAGGLTTYITIDGSNSLVNITKPLTLSNYASGLLQVNASGVVSVDSSTYLTGIAANSVGITELNVTDGTSGQVLTTDGNGTLSFTTVSASGANYYLDGITRTASTNTLVFSVNGTTNQSYTFGANAFTDTAIPVSGTDFDPAGTDNSTDVTLNTTSYDYLSITGQEITLGAIDYSTDITNTPSIPVSGTDFDPVGTDNSTNVTLASVTGNYLSISGQEITAGTVPVSLGGTGATTAADARTNLGVDPAGTDNSTDVTLVTTAANYLSINGQEITLAKVKASEINGGTTAGILTTNSSGVLSVDTSTYLTEVAFSDLTSTPTTLAGYGITDADNYVSWSIQNRHGTAISITSGKHIKFDGSSISGAGTSADPYVVDLSSINTDTQYTAGSGLTLNSNSFSVNGDLSGVTYIIGRDADDKYVVNSTNHAWYLDGTLDMRLDNAGNLDVDGDVIAFSTVTNSDRRLKTDISTIENASEKVSRLRGVEYTWDYGKHKGKRDIGLIAQEVEEVVPEVVSEGELLDGTTAKRVDYAKLVGLLIEANKELQDRVEQLEKKLDGFTK